MTEGPMSEVMTESSDLEAAHLVVSDPELWLRGLDLLNELPCHVADTHRVFKSIMRCPREHHVGAPQLLETPQTLEVRSVNEIKEHLVQLDVAVNRIIQPLFNEKQEERISA